MKRSRPGRCAGRCWPTPRHFLSLLAVLVTMSPFARSDVGTARSIKSVAGGTGVVVDPGNTELERGTSLLVVARFQGAVPAEARLVVEKPGSARGTSGHDPQPGRSYVRRPCRVGRNRPRLSRGVSAARAPRRFRSRCSNTPNCCAPTPSWSFRDYTSLEPKTVEDIRHVTAVEGTELTLLCRLNKDVATARLVDAKGQVDRTES